MNKDKTFGVLLGLIEMEGHDPMEAGEVAVEKHDADPDVVKELLDEHWDDAT